MLSLLLLASTTGQPLPADAVARCSRLPSSDLTFVPTASTTWRSEDGHVVLVAWADSPRPWHVGEHGCTVVAGTPWSLDADLDAPSGVAFELTDRIGTGDGAGVLARLTGPTVVARLRPDGSGFVAAPATGGGAVHVAQGDGLLAVSDRASLAATGAGRGRRDHALPALVRGALHATETAFEGVTRVVPGGRVTIAGRVAPTVDDGTAPWGESTDDLAALVATAADEVTSLVERAAGRDGDRVLLLGPDPASLVLAGAVAATGTAARFRVRPAAAGPGAVAAGRLAEVLGTELEPAPHPPTSGEQLDARVRAAVNRVEALVAPQPLRGVDVLDVGTAVLLAATPGGALAPDPGPTGRRLLRSQAWAEVDGARRTWEAGRGRVARSDAARRVLAEADLRAPARQRAAADLAAGARLLDPTAVPSVTTLALACAEQLEDATALLVGALHPPMLAARTPGGEEPPTSTSADWRLLAPVLEAHVLGHGRSAVEDVLDLDEVAMVVRAGAVPDADTLRALEGALALGVWAAGVDTHAPATSRAAEVRTDVEVADQTPTLVTGVTSRSLLELAGLAVPLDAVEEDALLGVSVDREVRDLVHRVLLAVGATPGALPADLDRRLSGTATAHLAGPARTLLARRGGTLADPRLALTLAFWRAHVATPRVVLVAERPPDLATRSPARLPTRDLLGWWVDAMTAAAASGADVRVVDPGDLVELDEAEATGWDGLEPDGDDAPDLVRVVRTVDSLVREVELDAARPLLRTIRAARAEEAPLPTAAPPPAAAPLHVVDELWERAVEADRRLAEQRATAEGLETRLLELERELSEVRSRRGLKAAWQVLTGRDA